MKSPELISNTINVDRGGISQVCEELTLAHQERCSIGVLFSSPPEKCSEEFRESFFFYGISFLSQASKNGKAGSLGWFLTVTQRSMY